MHKIQIVHGNFLYDALLFALDCTEDDYRLYNEISDGLSVIGIPQQCIYENGIWGAICNDGTNNVARQTCQALGYDGQ